MFDMGQWRSCLIYTWVSGAPVNIFSINDCLNIMFDNCQWRSCLRAVYHEIFVSCFEWYKSLIYCKCIFFWIKIKHMYMDMSEVKYYHISYLSCSIRRLCRFYSWKSHASNMICNCSFYIVTLFKTTAKRQIVKYYLYILIIGG